MSTKEERDAVAAVVDRVRAGEVELAERNATRAAIEGPRGGPSLLASEAAFTDWAGWVKMPAKDVPVGYHVRVWERQYPVTSNTTSGVTQNGRNGMVMLKGGPSPDYVHIGGYVYVYTGEGQ